MLPLACAMCGEDLPTRWSDAVESEQLRRRVASQTDLELPNVGLLCEPCDADMEAYIAGSHA